MAEYLDFEIEIGKGIGREYPIAVIRSPGGEARGQMVFPFDELALDSRLKDLQIALLRSGGQRRLLLTPQEQTIQDFGQKLFSALMTGDVRSRFDVSQREAARLGKGLRIKLRIQSPELASLPWEFMFDPRGGRIHLPFHADPDSTLYRNCTKYSTAGHHAAPACFGGYGLPSRIGIAGY